MTRAIWVCAALAATAYGQAPSRCFVEVAAPATAVLGEPVIVTVTVSWERAWFDEYAVAMVRRRADVPWHLTLPWLQSGSPWDAEVLAPPPSSSSIVVGVSGVGVRAIALPDDVRDGRAFARLQVRTRLVPQEAGVLNLAPANVRFAYATEFRDHLLRGREPVDRREATVSSAARRVRVGSIAAAAPAGYCGAVGDFNVELVSGGYEVAVGQVFEVVMTIAGDERTNLRGFDKPTFAGLDGFHLQGVLEEPLEAARRFRLSLIPLREGMDAVAGISFVTYSPEKGMFERLGGGAVPVRVIARRPGVELDAGVEQLIRDDAAAREGVVGWWRWALVLAAVIGLSLQRWYVGGRRRRGLRAAESALRAAVASGEPAACAAAFEQLLATVGGLPAFAAASTWSALERRGVAPEGLAQLQQVHAALDQARFGGPPPDGGDVLATADTLIRAIRG
ncbi:MAG: hypothetical protein VYA51_11150 [Planctomycetota bacterium]|nr:hypothetical protein [Planctomycetota bacterium]